MRNRALGIWTIVALSPFLSGCSQPTARALYPPALPAERAVSFANMSPVPGDELDVALVRPVAVRVFQSGEVIVDLIAVVPHTESNWNALPAPLNLDYMQASGAGLYTDNFNLPAKYHPCWRRIDRIVLRNAQGKSLQATRATLGDAPFEVNHEYLHATTEWRDNFKWIKITRDGKKYFASFTAVLLTTDVPLEVGQDVDVRIDPTSGPYPGYEEEWRTLRVEPFELVAAGG